VRSVSDVRAGVPRRERAARGHHLREGDTEAERQLAAAAQIRLIPTLMAFRDGMLVYSRPDALPVCTLVPLLQAVRDRDMDDVRRQIAEQAPARSA
jgi:thioredoxin 1